MGFYCPSQFGLNQGISTAASGLAEFEGNYINFAVEVTLSFVEC